MLYERVEWELQLLAISIDNDTYLHWDKVEYPSTVTHLLWKVTQLLYIRATPYALQIYRLTTEWILNHSFENVVQRLNRHQLHCIEVVVTNIPINLALREQLATQCYCHLEIEVVATTDNLVCRLWLRLTEVDVCTATDTEDRLLWSNIEEELRVVQRAQLLNENTCTIYDNNLSLLCRSLPICYLLLVCLQLLCVEYTLVATMVDATIEESWVLLTVPAQLRVDHCVDLLLALENLCEVVVLNLHATQLQLLCQEVQQLREVGSGVALPTENDILLWLSSKLCSQLCCKAYCSLECADSYGSLCLCFEYRTIDSTRVVKRVRIIHKTHNLEIYLS